ncbi:hypothetical protein EFR84_31870 [Rhizobium chutanense]|uniref:Uncharacterized protein n=1 Tax=Rhizobium chutanense TaxID=2035448 RepID=A0A3S0QH35_9HYPH|nr:hypothetical protein EFR84_31870 [Rhizobium chutanense]
MEHDAEKYQRFSGDVMLSLFKVKQQEPRPAEDPVAVLFSRRRPRRKRPASPLFPRLFDILSWKRSQ